MSTESSETVTRCHRCGRKLTSAASVAARYSRWCRAKIRAAALALAVRDFAQAQVDKARELIADGGIVAIRAGIYRAVSSKGDETYLTAAAGVCNCKAGLNGRRCYHVAAARMMAARA